MKDESLLEFMNKVDIKCKEIAIYKNEDKGLRIRQRRTCKG